MNIQLSGDEDVVTNMAFNGTRYSFSLILETDAITYEREVLVGENAITITVCNEANTAVITITGENDADLEIITRHMFARHASNELWIIFPHESVLRG